MVRLRGAFNPAFQLGCGVVIGLLGLLVLSDVRGWAATGAWPGTDLRAAPWAFLAGLLAGALIGRYRLRALREVLPQVDGRFFASERGPLAKVPDGEFAIRLQRLGYAVAFLACFGTATYTDGRLIPFASMSVFVVGLFLTGQTLAFVRLRLELRKGRPTAAAS